MLDALGLNLKEIIFAVVDFLILAAVLGKFLYKPFGCSGGQKEGHQGHL